MRNSGGIDPHTVHSAGLIRLTETGYGQLRLGNENQHNEKHVRVTEHTILTITFTTCVRHARSERLEGSSHWNQTLGEVGAQTFA